MRNDHNRCSVIALTLSETRDLHDTVTAKAFIFMYDIIRSKLHTLFSLTEI